MARASPTASSRRASGLRGTPPSPRARAVEYGHDDQRRVRDATASSRRPAPSSSLNAVSMLIEALFRRLEHGDRGRRHDGGDGVLVDELRMAVAAQEHAEIVEPGHEALQFHAVDEENVTEVLLLRT